MEDWKINKLKSLKDEVNELHPIIRAVLLADKTISLSEYTHGPQEMGADFVVARPDPTLVDENYVALIVKVGDIKQDYTAIKRQIDECAVERHFAGGRKKIYINEIWIVCNGSISNNAERKIHEEYKSRNIKFLDIDKLAKWVEREYPEYWSEVPADLSLYLRNLLVEINKIESYSSIAGQSVTVDLSQDLYEIEPLQSGQKFSRYSHKRRKTINKALEESRFFTIEGGMGSGKSTILRGLAKKFCDPASYHVEKIIPLLVQYSSIVEDAKERTLDLIEKASRGVDHRSAHRYLLLVDGVDEVKSASEGRLVDTVRILFEVVKEREDLTIVLGTRPTWTIEEGQMLLQYLRRYQVLPLSLDQIVKVVQSNCVAFGISERLRQDLGKSALIRALPRTPMSALLLARVLSADANEIPQTLPELYSKYIELALGRWDIKKGLMAEHEYPIIFKSLSRIAKYMLDNELQEMAVSEVIAMLEEHGRTREGLPPAAAIFQRISERSEVVSINKIRQTFSFRHKSLAEYLLAALEKERHGQSAPLTNPFNGYWLGVEYFYLGLIQDAGSRIDKLSRMQLTTEREKILRIFNFPDLMLAAYQTEYSHIEGAVYNLVMELTKYFLEVRDGDSSTQLRQLPEVQFFAALTFSLRQQFGYNYFKKALDHAQIQCQCDASLTDEERAITSFFIDSVRVELGDGDVFKFLAEKDLASLPWVVKIAIKHTASDDNLKVDHVGKIVKRINKTIRGNAGVKQHLSALYEAPMSAINKDRSLVK